MASTEALPEAMLAPMSLFGRYSIFFAGVPVRSDGSFLPSAATTPSSVESRRRPASVATRKTRADAPVGVEQAKQRLRVDRAARAGDSDGDDAALCVLRWHEWKLRVYAAGFGKVKASMGVGA